MRIRLIATLATVAGALVTAAPAAVAAPTPIHAVQGAGATTGQAGEVVTITGVVVGVDNQQAVSNYVDLDPSQAGLYVEAPRGQWDDDDATSEGIYVGGLAGSDRAARHVGRTVTVTGTVKEIYGLTAIDATGSTPAFGRRAPLPAPVTIDPGAAAVQAVAANGSRPYYETLEGMRARLAVGTANSGGTDVFGELFLQPGTTRERVFRDPAQTGPPNLISTSQDAGSRDVDPTNPSATPPSRTRVNGDLFDRVRDLVGPVGFAFSEYAIVPQPGAMPAVQHGPTRYPARAPRQPRHTLRVSEFNVENLFAPGMVDDNHTFTREEIDHKTTRIADGISRSLRRPDIVAVEEVASAASLREVARKLGGYRSYWEPSNDARHVAVGFLVKHGIRVQGTRQVGADATTTVAGCNDSPADDPQLFERPPLELAVRVGRTRMTLIANHLASLGHPEPCRQAQADFLRAQATALERSGREVLVLGDLNDFEDSPALTQNLVGADTSLHNLWGLAPAPERYSYQYRGQLQTLDHIFATAGLARRVRDMRYVHFDNDYYERNQTRDAAKVSDHDPPLATFALRR